MLDRLREGMDQKPARPHNEVAHPPIRRSEPDAPGVEVRLRATSTPAAMSLESFCRHRDACAIRLHEFFRQTSDVEELQR